MYFTPHYIPAQCPQPAQVGQYRPIYWPQNYLPPWCYPTPDLTAPINIGPDPRINMTLGQYNGGYAGPPGYPNGYGAYPVPEASSGGMSIEEMKRRGLLTPQEWQMYQQGQQRQPDPYLAEQQRRAAMYQKDFSKEEGGGGSLLLLGGIFLLLGSAIGFTGLKRKKRR